MSWHYLDRKAKASTRTYELYPDGNPEQALENMIRDVRAAHALRAPVTVQTVTTQAFRHGGNVVKAQIVSYEVTIGTVTDRTDQ